MIRFLAQFKTSTEIANQRTLRIFLRCILMSQVRFQQTKKRLSEPAQTLLEQLVVSEFSAKTASAPAMNHPTGKVS